MSITLERPVAGDRVAAMVVTSGPNGSRQVNQKIVLPDGSMVVTADELALLGGGDARAGRQQLRLMIELERDRKTFVGPTERPASVRRGGPEDRQAILELLLIDIAENAAAVAPVDEQRVLDQIDAGMPDKAGMIGVIDGPDGKPVAAVIMVPLMHWWSRAYYYQEATLFVHPDHRKSDHIRDLLRFQRWFVDGMTTRFGYRVYLICGVLGVHHVRRKIMLYRRQFRQVGAVFCYPSPFQGDTT